MNNVYSRLKAAGSILSRSVFVVLLILGTTVALQAQNVRVNSTGGVPVQTYPTLKAAFDAINAGTHQVTITVSIIGNTTETATAVLNSSIAPANYSGIIIKPEGGARMIQGNLTGAIIKLNGADNVVIDGSLTSGTRDLTIRNNTTQGTGTSVIWVASVSAANAATGNVVMNCKVEGSSPTAPWLLIAQSSGTTLGSVSEAPNNINLYANNEIRNGQYGIALVGVSSSNLDVENTVQDNIFSSIGWRGMHISNQLGVTVSKNTITGVSGISGNTGEQQMVGIYVVGGIQDGIIEKNTISDVKLTGPWGAYGIMLNSSSSNSGLNISNNFIFDVATGGFGSWDSKDDNPAGIGINNGGGYKIYSNSINMVTDNLGTGTTHSTAGIWIGGAAAITGLDLRNNILANEVPDGSRYSIYSNGNSSAFSTINYNDYFSTGMIARFDDGTAADLAAMQALTGQDLNSVAIDPNFSSPTNLHLAPNSPLNSLGTNIPGITQDIDDQVRPNPTDIGADEFTPPNCTNPANGGTASASTYEICGSGSAILSSTGYSFGLGTVYQWQVSTVGVGGPWSNLGAANSPVSSNTGTISATRYYRLQVTCSAGVPQYSNAITIIVNNPTVSGTNATRCGVGTVNLSATGTNIRWYATPTGGAALGTGPTFTTPVINATTTYYAASTSGGLFLSGGKPAPDGGDGGYTGEAGIRFDALQAFTITSVRIFPLAAGTITIELADNAGNTLPGRSWTGNVAPDPGGVVIPLNFSVPIGTNYRLVKRGFNISITRDFSPNSFPYSIAPAANLIGGILGTGNSTTYYFFYDWQVTTACEGVRVPVQAIVTAPPAVTVSPAAGPLRTICSGNSITLTANSGNSGYTYSWNPGNLTGNSITVTPTTTTTYTLVANDGTCRNDQEITVTVNNTPSPITINPSNASVCANSYQPVIVNGGLIPGVTLFQEKFNTFPIDTGKSFRMFGAGMTATQNTTYFQEGGSSVLLTYINSLSDASNYGYVSDTINLTGITNPVLSFHHIAALEGSATSNFDFGRVEYSTNGGVSWTTFPSTAYLGSGAVYGGTVSFNQSSYSDWDAQFASSASDPGAGPASDLWKEEAVDLSTWANQPYFRVRFRIKSDVSVLYFGWLLDNVRVSGIARAPVTFSPTTNLYTRVWPGPYTAYAGQALGVRDTIFFSSPGSAPQVYTATATGGVGCVRTATTTLSATNLTASVSITALNGSSFCQNEQVAFQAVPVNGGATPAYRWFINGTPYFATPHPDSIITRFAPGSIPNGANITVQMIGPAIPPCPAVNVTSPNFPVTVFDTSVVSISGGNTVCSDAPITLTATATGTITNYAWFRNGNPVGGNSNTLIVSQFGDYTVRVTTNNGCQTTSPVKTVGQNIWNMDIAPGPNGTISPPGTFNVLEVPCGDTIDFTITPNPGYIILDVLINGISVGAVPTYSYAPSGDDIIEAYFGISGCANPPTSLAGSNTSICASVASYNLNSQVNSIGGSASSAIWSTSGTGTFNGGGVYGTATTYTPSAADTSAGSVIITLTTNDPDGAGPCLPSSSSFTLTLTRAPIVTITGVAGFCTAGATSTLLTADVSFAAGTITNYQWLRGATPVGTGPTYNATIAGNYSVVVTGSNGCTGTGTLTVVAFTAPTVNILGIPFFCEGGFTDLSANVVEGSGTINPSGFQWEYDDIPFDNVWVPIPGATLGSYNVTSIGRYRVRITDNNGCQSAYSPFVNVTYDQTPMAGNYTIGMGPASCTNFISFATAVEALNNRSISDNVTLEAPGNYEEVVPIGGLKLGSQKLNDSTRIYGHTITFTRSGSGANPKLIAYENSGGTYQSNSATPDGIWALVGVDNVTIDQIDLAEDLVNNSGGPGPLMEYGFALFKRTNNDGAKNNTIQNCNITLSRDNTTSGLSPMSNGATGILVANSTPDFATTALVPASTFGTNSGNKFYGNIIREVNTGIALNGYAAPAPYTLGDQGNDVGGTITETGNEIINFGRNVVSGGAPTGITTANQWGINISHNIINNNDGTGSNTLTALRGIFNDFSENANATISYNTITLEGGATTAQSTFGIDTKIGNNGTTNTVSILNNDIQAKNLMLGNVGNVTVTGIIYNYASNPGPATLVLSNNNIHDLQMVNASASNTTVYGIHVSSRINVLNVNGNTFNNFSKSAGGGSATAPSVSSYFSPASATFNTLNFDNNIISNFTVTAGAVTTMVMGANFTSSAGSMYSFSNNQINNLAITGITGAVAGTIHGFFSNANVASTSELIQGNTVHDLSVSGTSSGAHVISGLAASSGNTVTVRTMSQNTIYNLYTAAGLSGSVSGIWSLAGFDVNIRRNYIHSLFAGQNSPASTVRGIFQATSPVAVTIANNMVSLDLTQAVAPAVGTQLNGSNSLIGIDYAAGSGNPKIYYNTVRVAGSGSGNFGSSAINIQSGTPVVDLRNNIFATYAMPSGTGASTALRRSNATFTGYNSQSNNNLFYAAQTASQPIFYYGTTPIATLAAFKAQAGFAPRELASVGDEPVFVDAAANNLHIDPTTNCTINGGAQVIAGFDQDIDGETRDASTPDIGSDEFLGTGGLAYVWKGVNTNWEDAVNWCPKVPDQFSNVTIPNAAPNYPILTTTTNTAGSITIDAGGIITINSGAILNVKGSTLAVEGTLTNNGTLAFNAGAGVAQSIPTGGGTISPMNILQVANAAGFTLHRDVTILGELRPTSGNITLNDTITLKSTATATAQVSALGGGVAINYAGVGKFIVENFINSGANKSWRFIAAPIGGTQTINQAWQEGQPAGVYTSTGYGMQIVGPTAAGPGFDMNNQFTSLKTYDPATVGWITVPGTMGPVSNTQGYMAYIRGDRGANTFGDLSNTTLRTGGPIKTGNITVNGTGLNRFISVGNPYPSALDYSAVTKNNLSPFYYVWDPVLGVDGAWQTIAFPSGIVTPGGGSYPSNTLRIESGQAFMVYTTNAVASITITESSKVSGSNLVTRAPFTGKVLTTRLFSLDAEGNAVLTDGTRAEFGSDYNPAVDGEDARKAGNFSESLGILVDGELISVERRPEVLVSDTIHYRLGQVRRQQYQFEFNGTDIARPGLEAFLEDNYLQTRTPVSLEGVSTVNFTVDNNDASGASDRFRLVFKVLAPVPVTFVDVSAETVGKDVRVRFRVDNEVNIRNYTVERSVNGRVFAEAGTVDANNSSEYSFNDVRPGTGTFFYRIRSNGFDANDVKYSDVATATIGGSPSLITIYPNPVKEDRQVKVKMENAEKGVYTAILRNHTGQVILRRKIVHGGSNALYSLDLKPMLVHGIYSLQIVDEQRRKTIFKIVY